jgi:hypothetical protein
MGAWGFGAFDNDDAMDWIAELEESEDGAVLEDALSAIPTDDSEYVEAPECSIAVAAAEVVAALAQHPSADLHEQVRDWVKNKPAPDERLRRRAHEVIARILRSSELKDLWSDGSDAEAWTASLHDLQRRLSGRNNPTRAAEE